MRSSGFLIAFAVVCLLLLMSPAAKGQTVEPVPGLGSPLSGLPLERNGTAKHAGSWNRSGRNDDCRTIAPGQSLVLLNYKGAGIIRRFWCTFPGKSRTMPTRTAT